MTQILVLRLSEPASWVVVDASGARLGPVATGSLADAAPLAAERRVIALAPGADIALAQPELPVRSGSRLAQVVPFALEEHLAGDVESFHFALGKSGDDGRTPVAAVEKSRLESWLKRLDEAGLVAEALFAETQCLPANPGKIVAVVDGGQLLVQEPGRMPVALDAEPLTEAFALAGLEGEDRHVQMYVSQEDWDKCEEMIEALREVAGTLDVQLLPDGPLPLFASVAVASPPLSLLSGAYAPKTGWQAQWRRWRVAAGLAAALLVVHVGTQVFDLVTLGLEEKRLDASMSETFQVAMPGVEQTADPRQQMQQRLGGSGGLDAAGLLGRLDGLSQAFTAVPGARIESMSWRDQRLDMRLSAPSGDALSELSRAAGQQGLNFDVQSTMPREGRVDGVVSIAAGSS
ncbi:MAG: ral secretion pathway protein [Proteobacteria bacterium]|nr:ral secretion pathway protein [Pseudomonadota bacterium]